MIPAPDNVPKHSGLSDVFGMFLDALNWLKQVEALTTDIDSNPAPAQLNADMLQLYQLLSSSNSQYAALSKDGNGAISAYATQLNSLVDAYASTLVMQVQNPQYVEEDGTIPTTPLSNRDLQPITFMEFYKAINDNDQTQNVYSYDPDQDEYQYGSAQQWVPYLVSCDTAGSAAALAALKNFITSN